MIDENLSLIRAHRNNIARYRELMKTHLTELERKFFERRLAEEQAALQKIAASTFPMTFRLPAPPVTMGRLARGRQRDRPSAKYQAERALFQLMNVMSRRLFRSQDGNRNPEERDTL